MPTFKKHSRFLKSAILGSKRAFFLVTVLSSIAFLSVIVTQVSDMVFQSASIVSSVKDSLSADSVCDSALEIVKSVLKDDIQKNGYDFYSEDFSNTEELWSKTYIFPVDVIYGTVRAVITDETAKLNVNSLVDSAGRAEGLAKDSYLMVLQKFFKTMNVDESLAGYILDWIDSDSEGMFERDKPRNWFIPYPEELLKLSEKIPLRSDNFQKLFSNYFEGREDATSSPYLTFWPYAGVIKINVNTAPKEVIASVIDTPDSLDIADKIVQERKRAPFKSYSEFVNFLQRLIPVRKERFFNIDPTFLFDVRSDIFSVKIYCKVNETQVGIFSVISRPYAGDMKILAFRRF